MAERRREVNASLLSGASCWWMAQLAAPADLRQHIAVAVAVAVCVALIVTAVEVSVVVGILIEAAVVAAIVVALWVGWRWGGKVRTRPAWANAARQACSPKRKPPAGGRGVQPLTGDTPQ